MVKARSPKTIFLHDEEPLVTAELLLPCRKRCWFSTIPWILTWSGS
mgnify:FL=1